jgi:hypothetical protein
VFSLFPISNDLCLTPCPSQTEISIIPFTLQNNSTTVVLRAPLCSRVLGTNQSFKSLKVHCPWEGVFKYPAAGEGESRAGAGGSESSIIMSQFWKPGSQKPQTFVMDDEEGGVIPFAVHHSSASGYLLF